MLYDESRETVEEKKFVLFHLIMYLWFLHSSRNLSGYGYSRDKYPSRGGGRSWRGHEIRAGLIEFWTGRAGEFVKKLGDCDQRFLRFRRINDRSFVETTNKKSDGASEWLR